MSKSSKTFINKTEDKVRVTRKSEILPRRSILCG